MLRAKPSTPECALAAEMFNHFCSAGTMKQILGLHRSICEQLSLKPTRLPDYYPKLKDKLANSWKAQAVFKKFDSRANHKVYAKGTACANLRVLIIGAGPCGLRAAIECQLLGAKVVVVEKRDRMSRNNVLHLWPFVIHDLRALGAKKFYGKFCAGSIDHISIRQLQCLLLKMCLLLGVEFHEGVGFEQLLEPTVTESGEKLGWRARVEPADHPVSQLEFDAVVGADGKRNTLQDFKRKEFRGKLAIAITANFINRHTEQEASVQEISGVAFIFKQKFFKDLQAETGIDLENIVYYKDETHYFVMTAKKTSLLEKGVLLEDNPDTAELLRAENVNQEALKNYALEAANYSTEGQLPRLDFALNARGAEDVTLFDFTSMTSALNASMVYERKGFRLLMCLVGDSLLEPFWPTGSGCARGFLSALDAAWAVRTWGMSPPPHPIDVIAERESTYRLLGQTTPENLNREFGGYTLDPRTRYPNLNKSSVTAHRVAHYYNSDDPLPIDASASMRKRRRETQVGQDTLVAWLTRAVGKDVHSLEEAVSPWVVAALVRTYRPDLLPLAANDLACYAVLMDEFNIQPMGTGRCAMRGEVSDGRMRAYLRSVYRAFKGEVPHMHHETDVLAATAKIMPSAVPSVARVTEAVRHTRKRRSRSAHVSSVPPPAPTQPRLRHGVGKLALDEVAFIGRQREEQRKQREVGKLALATQPFAPAIHDRPTLREVGRLGSLDSAPIERFDPKPRRSVGRLQVPLQFERDIFPQCEQRVAEKHKPGKRRAAREMARRHFETSLRLLEAGSMYAPSGSADLELDYGLQQYRAAAPEFGERVKQLERRLMHTEMGRADAVAGARSERSGGTVARLAAELAGIGKRATPPRARKPNDLLRAVGRIDQADWNVKEIERQIHENRLGRPQPRQAERVPKWDREQFLARQNRVVTGGTEEDDRYGQLDQTIRLLDQKRRDSGRPAQGTKKVARLADQFAKKDEIEPEKPYNLAQRRTRRNPEGRDMEKDKVCKQVDQKRSDSGQPSQGTKKAPTAARCSVCAARVFAAEAVTADGLTLHKACFRCVVCRTALRPGCYNISSNGTRLTCLRHVGVSVLDAPTSHNQPVPKLRERFREEEDPEREMDEEEWTDRNFLASETSGAGGLSEEEEESSSEEYTEAAESVGEGAEGVTAAAADATAAPSDDEEVIYVSDDDSYGYDHSSDDCASSSGSEWASRREARRREVPAASARSAPGSASSEVETDEESDSSELETSSATEVSTDSEFEEEEAAPPKVPPAITVTAPPPVPPAVHPAPPAMPHNPRPRAAPEYSTPLSRTRSAGGLATKRALELKRLYLLGEPSPAPVRRSDSASHIDLKNVNRNISEIQKLQLLLHPAPAAVVQEQYKPTKLFLLEYPIEKPQQPVLTIQQNEIEPPPDILADIPKTPTQEKPLDTDSLSDDSSSMTKTIPNPPPPRLEVHNASGELVQLDSLLLVCASSEEAEGKHLIVSETPESVPKPESESSESCRDATTLALTETELSDWAADGGVLDELEDRPDSKQGCRTSARNPRVLGAPKNIHETKNISTLAAHVCGRTAEEIPVIYSNATEHFEFADEGDDLSINIMPPRNDGYLEFVDDDYRVDDNLVKDRSINFIERPSSMFVQYPSLEPEVEAKPIEIEGSAVELLKNSDETPSPITLNSDTPTITELSSTLLNNGNFSLSKSSFTNLTDMSSSKTSTSYSEDTSLPLTVDAPMITKPGPISFSVPLTFVVRPPAPRVQIPEETAQHPSEPHSPVTPVDRPLYSLVKSSSASPVSPKIVEASSKVEELKRERENQTEVVRRLVLERMGGGPAAVRKSSRRVRAPPSSGAPPVPPAPAIPPPPARPPPPLRLMPSMSDPELARVRRRRGIIQTVSDFFNRRVGSRKKWRSEPERFYVSKECLCEMERAACGEGARCRRLASDASSRPRAAPPRRRASHAAAPAAHAAHAAHPPPPPLSQLVLSPRHFASYACCPSYHRPHGGPPLPIKIWSLD